MGDFENFASRHNIVRQINATRILLESKKTLPADLNPVSFRSGILNVEVESQTARHFYEPKKQELLDEINKSLATDKIKEIKFRVN